MTGAREVFRPVRALLVAFVLLVSSPAAAQATTPVASWLNDSAHEVAAARLIAVLQASGIQGIATCSLGCTLSVPVADYGRALGILQATIRAEHLDVEVILPTITS